MVALERETRKGFKRSTERETEEGEVVLPCFYSPFFLWVTEHGMMVVGSGRIGD